MKTKFFFVIIFFVLLFLIFIVPLVQASLIGNVWYNTLIFLGIIEITDANHLNSDRVVISDIYNEVKSLDGIWSEEIFEEEYVRVTFKQNLTSNKDITIYPRIVSGNPKIEVYEKDSETKIAEFTSLNENEYNKIFLINLISKNQDTFDLKIVGGSVELNHIIDPTTVTTVPTDSAYSSPDSSGSCTLSAIQIDDTITCDLFTMDSGETGHMNITHATSIPNGATINEVWACIVFWMNSNKATEIGDGPLTVDVGHTDGGLTWQNKITASETGIDPYETENSYCWNITTFITTEAAAEDVRIKIQYTEGDDNNQGFKIDYSNVTITYTTASTCTCPGSENNWEINMGDSCNITNACDLGTGNITFTGTGTTTFNATISAANLEYPATGQTLYIGSNALITIG